MIAPDGTTVEVVEGDTVYRLGDRWVRHSHDGRRHYVTIGWGTTLRTDHLTLASSDLAEAAIGNVLSDEAARRPPQ